jgi:anti-sigma regulatory factor (Ser/Thr protein kinase)
VRVQNTRVALPRRFSHRGALYNTQSELVDLAVPLIEQARRRGAPVVLAVATSTERLIREVVGPSGLVRLSAPEPELRRSGQTVAVRRARELRELTDRDGPIVVIAQHDPDMGLLDVRTWVETDAAMNIALTTMPVTMTCLYRDPLDPVLAAAARWNHPMWVREDGSALENPDHREPADVLTACPAGAPAPLGPADRELTFTPWQLTDLREVVGGAARAAGLSPERTDDFVLAVNEVAGNAVEHGYGTGLLQLWLRDRLLTCEVHDSGVLCDPLPGLRLPHPAEHRGRGVWIARQLCDLLHVWADHDGTHVRLQTARGSHVPDPV